MGGVPALLDVLRRHLADCCAPVSLGASLHIASRDRCRIACMAPDLLCAQLLSWACQTTCRTLLGKVRRLQAHLIR